MFLGQVWSPEVKWILFFPYRELGRRFWKDGSSHQKLGTGYVTVLKLDGDICTTRIFTASANVDIKSKSSYCGWIEVILLLCWYCNPWLQRIIILIIFFIWSRQGCKARTILGFLWVSKEAKKGTDFVLEKNNKMQEEHGLFTASPNCVYYVQEWRRMVGKLSQSHQSLSPVFDSSSRCNMWGAVQVHCWGSFVTSRLQRDNFVTGNQKHVITISMNSFQHKTQY